MYSPFCHFYFVFSSLTRLSNIFVPSFLVFVVSPQTIFAFFFFGPMLSFSSSSTAGSGCFPVLSGIAAGRTTFASSPMAAAIAIALVRARLVAVAAPTSFFFFRSAAAAFLLFFFSSTAGSGMI